MVSINYIMSYLTAQAQITMDDPCGMYGNRLGKDVPNNVP